MPKSSCLIGVQQNQIHCDSETLAILTYLTEQSNSLYNCGVYWARQIYFKTKRIISKYDPIYEVGKNIHAQALPSVAAQQTLLSVSEAFKSFRGLRELFLKGELDQKPSPPNYRKSGGLFKISFPNTGAGKPFLRFGMIRFPLGLQVARWFGLKEFFLPFPANLQVDMGDKNNQQFVLMPLAKLKVRLEQLCSIYNIRFAETEEANTSCASYLDGDSLPEYGQKPQGWKASGQRIKRGLYRTKNRSLINADLNGSANILFKVARNLDIDLSRLGKRCLTTVSRIKLWAMPKSKFLSERIPCL